ncbi:MAG: alpha/beta hydrolase [Burkholderiales bacterium]|nr:alpha/beta hydrolase [Burkholderiales bacterium]
MTGARGTHAVVCVHGLWMSGFATTFWRNRLRAAGYAAQAFSYSSLRAPLAASAGRLAQVVDRLPQETVHFAGHSFGGVLILGMLAARDWQLGTRRLGRVVMVGSPWAGSHVAASLAARRGKLGRMMLGEALPEWLAAPRPEIPAQVEVGVIAGTRPYGAGRLLGPGLTAPHDGTVSVAETRVPGAREHLCLPVSHTEMLLSAKVAQQITAFVTAGRFAA